MSFFTNEEDDDFAPSSNSNLASIFQDPTESQASTKSLTYTAPKQPTNVKPAPAASTNQSVAAAAAVTCYKLTNEKYEALQGKIGLALLAEHESKLFRIVLYQNKEKPLASAKITNPEFTFTSQPGNFCSFYDDQRQNWAVLFDSKEMAQKFLDEIERAKTILGRGKEAEKTISKPADPPPSKDKADGSTPAPSIPEKENSKTKLISRIAKLGQPILPLTGALVADESDSEQVIQSSPEPEVQERPPKPKKLARPIPAKPTLQTPVDNNNVTVTTMSLGAQPPFYPLMSGHQSLPMMQYVPAYPATSSLANSSHFEALMSETRTHNSEVRMHLCRLSDKIELVAQKQSPGFESQFRGHATRHPDEFPQTEVMQKLEKQTSEQSEKLDRILAWIATKGSTPPAEETDGWLVIKQKEAESNIQQLKEENQRLSSQLGDVIRKSEDSISEIKRLKSAMEDDRIAIQRLTTEGVEREGIIRQLKEENDRLKEPPMEKKGDNKEDDEVVKNLKEENARLTASIKTLEEDVVAKLREEKAHLTAQLESSGSCASELDEKLLIYQSKCADLESRCHQYEALAQEKDQLSRKLQEEKEQLGTEAARARSLADALRQQLDQTEKVTQSTDAPQTSTGVAEQVKTIMNKTYKQALKQFQPEESYSFQSIKAILSAVIRDVTLAVLNEGDGPSPPAEEAEKVDTVQVDVKSPTDEASPSVGSEENTDTNEELSKPQEEQPDVEVKERSPSFLETLQSSLAAAQSGQSEPVWKPDPPPPPLFDDSDDDDAWLS